MPFPGLWGKIFRNSDGQKTLVKQGACSDVHTGLAAINQSINQSIQIYLNTVKSSVHGLSNYYKSNKTVIDLYIHTSTISTTGLQDCRVGVHLNYYNTYL